jgi:hypothetical protein
LRRGFDKHPRSACFQRRQSLRADGDIVVAKADALQRTARELTPDLS